jgi:hypothetical protein
VTQTLLRYFGFCLRSRKRFGAHPEVTLLLPAGDALQAQDRVLFDRLVIRSEHSKTLRKTLEKPTSEDKSDELVDFVYIRMFVSQLLKRIEDDPLNPKYLLTVPRVGYRFNEQPIGN